jgi:hypothetical protein
MTGKLRLSNLDIITLILKVASTALPRRYIYLTNTVIFSIT